MTPFQARQMWNQMMRDRLVLEKGEHRSEFHKRELERNIQTNERALKEHGRFNPEGRRERISRPKTLPTKFGDFMEEVEREAAAEGPEATAELRSLRAGFRSARRKRAPNVPNRDVGWWGGTEPMRKVVQWGVETARRGGVFLTDDVSFEGLKKGLEGAGMSEEDAHETARHIYLRRGIVDPSPFGGGRQSQE